MAVIRTLKCRHKCRAGGGGGRGGRVLGGRGHPVAVRLVLGEQRARRDGGKAGDSGWGGGGRGGVAARRCHARRPCVVRKRGLIVDLHSSPPGVLPRACCRAGGCPGARTVYGNR